MRQYRHHTIKCRLDWEVFKAEIAKCTEFPKVWAMDTETSGLDIMRSRPFVFQCGYLNPFYHYGDIFTIDLTECPEGKEYIKETLQMITDHNALLLGHNVKFDMHMLTNIGIDPTSPRIADTMSYIRYAHDALHVKEGGPPLGLKDYARRYIDKNAKDFERALKDQRKDQAKKYNSLLGDSEKAIKAAFSDSITEVEDLPENLRPIYESWHANLPTYLRLKVKGLVEADDIRYSDLDRDTLIRYAYLDIVYTLEIYLHTLPKIEERQQQVGIELEEKLIKPLYRLERTGMQIDKEYLLASKERLRSEIKAKRSLLEELAGEPVSVGQSGLLQLILRKKYDIDVNATSEQELEGYSDNPMVDCILKLRSLEKWYTTYILRFEKMSINRDRIYTQINSVGAVSGRVTSDFQQFPKEALLDDTGRELFHPRKLVLAPENEYLVYIDYSQIELRFQAMYTVLVGDPDKNMLRAYMPYECDPATWEPVDLHATTTEAAGFSKDDPNFKHYRKTIGKKVNFAKNYGASYSKIAEMFPDRTPEEIRRIDEAYYKAFPGVKTYHNYCFERADWYEYTPNMFGVRYYGANGHKLRNLLVQGSAAHFLKYKICDIDKFIQDNNLKTRIQMQIHDELVFEIPKEELWVIPKIKSIMEDWDDAIVPLIAEVEISNTTWAAKDAPSGEVMKYIESEPETDKE